MDFENALRAMKDGKRVTRSSWGDNLDEWVELRKLDGLVWVSAKAPNEFSEWQPSYDSLVADDWQLYETPNVIWSMLIDSKTYRCVLGYGQWVIQSSSAEEPGWRYVEGGDSPQELLARFCRKLEAQVSTPKDIG